jgi:hypothetical protein
MDDIRKLVKRKTSANSLTTGRDRRLSVESESSNRRSRFSKLLATKALRRSSATNEDNDSTTSTGTSQLDLTQPSDLPDIQLNLVDSDPDDLIVDEAEK